MLRTALPPEGFEAQPRILHPVSAVPQHAEQALARQAELPPDPIGDAYQGGTFCSDEYTADGTDPQKRR